MREKDKLDLLIDGGLSTYAESSPGLEQRVLSALAAAPPGPANSAAAKPRRAQLPLRRIMPWAVGLAAAACLLLVLFVHKSERPLPALARNQPLPRATSTATAATTGKAIRVTRRRLMNHPHPPRPSSQAIAFPKLDIFPTPKPLTPEEQALIQFANAPEAEHKALALAQKQMDAPIRIAAINIPPINPPDQGLH